MNAQTKLIEYGSELKNKSNTALKDMTPEEIIGQAFIEGICIRRDGSSRTIVNVTRTGKTITATETVISKVSEIVDGKLTSREVSKTTETLKIEL